ncbi:MAG TPA: hypothetical protein VJQ55_03570 [Candidatus Binatia bacterium]|nr:hypothetical protein [Candidatus Binatia bacterium]
MDTESKISSKVISIDRNVLRAVKCEECGAKMYPQSMLESHLLRHRRRQRWFNAEIRKLRHTFSHMRDIA